MIRRVNECHREAQRVMRHAATIASLYKRHANRTSDVKRQIEMLTNLFTRTDELITIITNYCVRLTGDTRSIRESYATHKRAIAQIKDQHKQSRSLLTAITDIVRGIRQSAQLFLSSAQTLACLAKNTEIKAHHARAEGEGLSIIAQQCLKLAHQARAPFAEFYQRVQKLQEIADPITAELVNVIRLSSRSEGLLSHAFQSLDNLDHAVSSIQGILALLENHRTLSNQLEQKAVEVLALLEDYISSSAKIVEEAMASCEQLRVLTQRLKKLPVSEIAATDNYSYSAPENLDDDCQPLLREYIDLLEQLTHQADLPVVTKLPLLKDIGMIGKRIDELSVSANDLAKRENELERGTADIIHLRTNIEQFLTETHTTSSHILECTSRLDKEIVAIEAVLEQTRSIFSKIRTLSVYAKIEEGRSHRYTGILAPVVHGYAQLEQQAAETYAHLMPQIVNLKLHTQRLRKEQKIPSLEIIKQPDYAKIKVFLDDLTRISGEKTRLVSNIADNMAQLQCDCERLNQAWRDYRKKLPRVDEVKKHLNSASPPSTSTETATTA